MTEVRIRPPSTTGYRVSAAFAVLGNGVLLLLVHAWPGWEALSFLTDDTTRVLPFVDALLVAGIAVGILQLARPEGASVPAGTLLTTVFSLAATVRVLQVFPFDLGSGWQVVVRMVLWLGIVGAVVGILAAFVALLRLRAARR
jgi:FtsH-binding integral membrane protein